MWWLDMVDRWWSGLGELGAAGVDLPVQREREGITKKRIENLPPLFIAVVDGAYIGASTAKTWKNEITH